MGLTVAKKKRSGSGFVWGLLIGVAIGAAAVWVLTPQPGEIEIARTRTTSGVGGADETNGAVGVNGAEGPTIVDLAMAAVERVRGRFDEAMALGREAYEQGQAEVMQRFNQARAGE